MSSDQHREAKEELTKFAKFLREAEPGQSFVYFIGSTSEKERKIYSKHFALAMFHAENNQVALFQNRLDNKETVYYATRISRETAEKLDSFKNGQPLETAFADLTDIKLEKI